MYVDICGRDGTIEASQEFAAESRQKTIMVAAGQLGRNYLSQNLIEIRANRKIGQVGFETKREKLTLNPRFSPQLAEILSYHQLRRMVKKCGWRIFLSFLLGMEGMNIKGSIFNIFKFQKWKYQVGFCIYVWKERTKVEDVYLRINTQIYLHHRL